MILHCRCCRHPRSLRGVADVSPREGDGRRAFLAVPAGSGEEGRPQGDTVLHGGQSCLNPASGYVGS
jgi:hypothetical protein